LALMVDEDARLNLQQAKADLAQAKAELEQRNPSLTPEKLSICNTTTFDI